MNGLVVFKAEYAHPVPFGMLVELLLVQSLREEDRVVALVGRRRVGEGGERDGQGPLRGHRRRTLRRRRRRGEAQRRSPVHGAAAGVRHMEAEVSPPAVGRHPGHGAPRGDGRDGSDLDESAKSTAERVECDESTAALEDTAPKVKEHRETGPDAVGVRGKGATTTTGAPNPCHLECRANPARVTRCVRRIQLSTQHILTYPVDETTEVDEPPVGEETFAKDGPDDGSLAEEVNLGLMDGLTVNQRFEEQPRSYFEEKVGT